MGWGDVVFKNKKLLVAGITVLLLALLIVPGLITTLLSTPVGIVASGVIVTGSVLAFTTRDGNSENSATGQELERVPPINNTSEPIRLSGDSGTSRASKPKTDAKSKVVDANTSNQPPKLTTTNLGNSKTTQLVYSSCDFKYLYSYFKEKEFTSTIENKVLIGVLNNDTTIKIGKSQKGYVIDIDGPKVKVFKMVKKQDDILKILKDNKV